MVFSFAGEYFPAGYYDANGVYYTARAATGPSATAIYNPSDYVAPATSPITNLTVQQAPLASWSSPLPTGYWSRPIEPNNREWVAIGGNFPWNEAILAGSGTDSVTNEYYGPYIPAVNTAHIVWNQIGAMSGMIGGETGNYATLGGPTTITAPSVIYMGRGYATVTKAINGQPSQSYAECYDIQTGQIYYDIPTALGGVTPTQVTYWLAQDPLAPGHAAYVAELFTISGSFLYKINPVNGAITSNTTLPNFGLNGIANFFYRDGYYLSFVYNSSTNSVYDGVPVTLAYNGYLINWTEQNVAGSTTTATSSRAAISAAFATRIVGNLSVTLPESFRTLYEPNFGYGYGAYDPVTGISITENRFIYGGFYGSSFEATSFVNTTMPIGGTTSVIWNITTSPTEILDAYRPTNGWCRDGIYAYEMERGFIQARSETTGAILWNTTMNDYPWGEFWLYDEAAYGQLLYAIGYTGVWALNETNGAIVWHTADPAIAFETPYTSNGTSDYAIARIRVIGSLNADGSAGSDGIVYVTNGEHSTIYPSTRGWGLIAINATTGQTLWKIMGTDLSAGAASDGYLVTTADYDGSLNVLGKGTSTTTVSAPQTAITSGTPVILSGSVLDNSIAQKGTPAVSDASMATWMDYLHFQMPIDGLYHNITITGVPVTISAVDPNGNLVSLGTTTSDVSGTYSLKWTPTTVGDYKISAVFAGSNAYGSSYAETATTVVNAQVTPTPTTTSTSGLATSADLLTYIIAVGIAIIIAIAIATVLILRKH
jgi:hypothetical protein